MCLLPMHKISAKKGVGLYYIMGVYYVFYGNRLIYNLAIYFVIILLYV